MKLAMSLMVANDQDTIPDLVPSRPAPVPPSRRDSVPTSSYTLSMAAARMASAPSSGFDADANDDRPRRPSFSFLSRSKTGDTQKVRSSEGREMLRKQKAADDEEFKRQQRIFTEKPPQIAPHVPLPVIGTFGGEGSSESVAVNSPNSFNSARQQSANFSRPKQFNNLSPSTSGTSIGSPNIPATSTMSKSQTVPDGIGDTGARGQYVDPYAKLESMANRGRSNYAGSVPGSNASTPRKIRRRKDPTPFNILLVGAKESGKTSIKDLLTVSLAPKSASKQPEQKPANHRHSKSGIPAFTASYVETQYDGERVGLTLWDSLGLDKNIVDLQLREIISFIESKFEETFSEEQKVMRSPGAKDTHIHCVLLVMDPARLTALHKRSPDHFSANGDVTPYTPALEDDLNMLAMKALSGKTTVIPVISKADTVTQAHMAYLKNAVWSGIQAHSLDPLEALGLDDADDNDDESEYSGSENGLGIQQSSPPVAAAKSRGVSENIDDSSVIDDLDSPSSDDRRTASSTTTPSPAVHKKPSRNALAKSSSEDNDEIYIPFSVLSPDPHTLPYQLTRSFPWGEADPLNPTHCDYHRLRESLFSEWRVELRTASHEKWYETWRTSRLRSGKQSPRMRQLGGVTPASSVPQKGRTFSPSYPTYEKKSPLNPVPEHNRDMSVNSFSTAPEARRISPMVPSSPPANFHQAGAPGGMMYPGGASALIGRGMAI